MAEGALGPHLLLHSIGQPELFGRRADALPKQVPLEAYAKLYQPVFFQGQLVTSKISY